MRIKFRKLLKIRDVVFVDNYERMYERVTKWVSRPDGTMIAHYIYMY